MLRSTSVSGSPTDLEAAPAVGNPFKKSAPTANTPMNIMAQAILLFTGTLAIPSPGPLHYIESSPYCNPVCDSYHDSLQDTARTAAFD